MNEKPYAPRDLLLQYLGGDEEKLERYLRLLAACASAFEGLIAWCGAFTWKKTSRTRFSRKNPSTASLPPSRRR